METAAAEAFPGTVAFVAFVASAASAASAAYQGIGASAAFEASEMEMKGAALAATFPLVGQVESNTEVSVRLAMMETLRLLESPEV